MGVSVDQYRASIGAFAFAHSVLLNRTAQWCRNGITKEMFAPTMSGQIIVLSILLMLLFIAGIEQNPGPGSNTDSSEVQENDGCGMAGVNRIPDLKKNEILGVEELMTGRKSTRPTSDESIPLVSPATSETASLQPSYVAGIKIVPEQPSSAIIAGRNASDPVPTAGLCDEDGCINQQTTSRSGTDAARPIGYMTDHSKIDVHSKQKILRAVSRKSTTELFHCDVDDSGFSDEQVPSGSRERFRLGGSTPCSHLNVPSPVVPASDRRRTWHNDLKITKNQSQRGNCNLHAPILHSIIGSQIRSSSEQAGSIKTESNISFSGPVATVVASSEEPNQIASSLLAQQESPGASSEKNPQSSSVGICRTEDGTGKADTVRAMIIDLQSTHSKKNLECNLGNSNVKLKNTDEASNNSGKNSLQEVIECSNKQHLDSEFPNLKENIESCEKLTPEKEEFEKCRKDEEKQDCLTKLDYSNSDHVLKTEKSGLEQRSSEVLFKDGNGRSCADCSKARRVENLRSLQRGQHISIPGEHSRYYFKSQCKQISAYQHHAIVKQIVQRSRQMAKVILIHFYKEDKVIKVREQQREFKLQFDDVFIIDYHYPRYTAESIVQRAESLLKQSENEELFKIYDFLIKNCEDFATWCVLGEEKSLQTDTFFNNIVQILWNIFGGIDVIASLDYIATYVPLVVLGTISTASIIYCIFMTVYLIKQYWYINCTKISLHCLIKKLLNLLQQFGAFSLVAFISFVIVNFALPGVKLAILGTCSAANIIYCFIKTAYLIKQYRYDQNVCCHCLKDKLLDLWLQLGIFGLTYSILFASVNFALPLQIPLIVGLVLGGTMLTLAVPRIRKALSPVQYSQEEITTLSGMKVGEVASLTYYGIRHLIVLSDVKCSNDPKKGTVRGIHYSLPSLFGIREIVEENFQVDLERSKVYLVQFNTLFTFSPVKVIDRARKRVGERKWNMFFNRSSHLCQWAKVNLDYNFEETECLDDQETRDMHSGSLSSLHMGKDDVHLMNEIQPGDVVEYGYDKGIIVKLKDVKDGRVFDMHMVIRKNCFDNRGRKVLDRIDLNRDYLKIHRYHPVHCVSRSERVEKACSMIGRMIPCWTQEGFIKDIILRPRKN